ncbi:MAG: thioesterase [Crocinitomicaceae bacterium]|nr:thioesterase [Crocinitomicaceae bacterium]
MNNELPKLITDQMFNNDPFSKWMGIERVEDGVGTNTLKMKVREEMLNGFGILHGGIAFSLADSALAFAANSHGRKCLSVENSIHYTGSCTTGDEIIARASEVSRSHKIAVYSVEVKKASGEKVAEFRGTVYRSSKEWEVG